MKDLQDGAMFLSFLAALKPKQILALEQWQYERRSVESSQKDALEKLEIIKQVKHERCIK